MTSGPTQWLPTLYVDLSTLPPHPAPPFFAAFEEKVKGIEGIKGERQEKVTVKVK